MQKFARHRSVDELKAICAERGFRIKTDRYEAGDDHIGVLAIIGGDTYGVGYSAFNGRFFGETPDGIWFTSDMEHLDHEPWFQALLNLFYTDDPEPREADHAA